MQIVKACKLVMLLIVVFVTHLSLSLLAVASADVQRSTGDQSPSLQQALSLVQQGAFYEGMEGLRQLGDAGDSNAYFHLAQIHRLGIHGEKSLKVAAMYYRLASEIGHIEASTKLANLLFFSENATIAAEKEAISLWQKLALNDDVEALYILGTLYWNGDGGLVADPVRGYGLIWRASELGYADAIASEVIMAADLSFDARNRSRAYADNFIQEAFVEVPLDIELVFDTIVTAAGGDEQPAHAQNKWQIQVGFAQSQDRLNDYTENIQSDIGSYLDDLIVGSEETDNGLYLVTFGQFMSLDQAVTRCVYLKKKGYDCGAIAIKNPDL